MSVVFYHTAFLLPGNVHTEFQGVGIFFVISGFIISHVAGNNPADFFYRRVVRIVPLYWIATSVSIYWFGSGSSRRFQMLIGIVLIFFTGKLFAKFEKRYFGGVHDKRYLLSRCFIAVLILGLVLAPAYLWMAGTGRYLFLLKSLFFVPALDINGNLQPYLGIGWTLNLEMFFYVIFGGALFAGKHVAPILASAVLIGIKMVYMTGLCTNTYFMFYSHDYVIFFILGMMLNYAFLAIKDRVVPKKSSIALLVAAAAYLLLYNLVPGGLFPFLKGPLVYVALYSGPTMLVGAALTCHLAGIQCRWKSVVVLGNASYALYLLHPMIVETLRPLALSYSSLDFAAHISGVLVVFLLALPVSIASYTFLEHPIQSELKDLKKVTVNLFFPSTASLCPR